MGRCNRYHYKCGVDSKVTIKCPKCGVKTDFEQNYAEIVMWKCGHAFTMEYTGYYDDDDNFHGE